MANRYWRGGAGTWDTTTTTNWSTTSGGAGGASVPTATDSVFFDQAGTYTVTCTGALTCLDITVSAGTVTFATGTTPTFAISGSMSLIAGTVWSTTGNITFNSTSSGKTITTNGTTLAGQVNFNGVGGVWTLGSAVTISANVSLTSGTIALSSFTFTITLLQSNNTNIRSISLGTGNIVITNGSNCWNFTTTTNLTITGTGTVSLTSAAAKTFIGGSFSYSGVTLNQGGAGALTITGSNTFGSITNTYNATGATSILFTAGTTSTFTNWNASGAAGKLLTINSVTAATHTLSKSSGVVNADYLSLTNSIATGGATWYAGANSTNVSGNTGWIFTAVPVTTGNFFFMFK